MEEKLKAFCEMEYNEVAKWGGSVEKAIDRCYGATMFCTNNCFPSHNYDLGNWWDTEMLPKFRKLQNRG